MGIRRYALGLRVWHFLLGMTAGIISETGMSSHELLCIIGLYFSPLKIQILLPFSGLDIVICQKAGSSVL
jgi:hypothetical protein